MHNLGAPFVSRRGPDVSRPPTGARPPITPTSQTSTQPDSPGGSCAATPSSALIAAEPPHPSRMHPSRLLTLMRSNTQPNQ